MTDGAPIAPDPMVQTALQLLPVPAHDPGFWAELGALLAAEPPRQVHEPALAIGPTLTTSGGPAPADVRRLAVDPSPAVSGVPVGAAAEVSASAPVRDGRLIDPATDPALHLVPLSLRRRSNVVLLAVAVAAAALVAVSGAALVRHRAENGLGPTDVVGVPTAVAAPTILPADGSRISARSVLLEAA